MNLDDLKLKYNQWKIYFELLPHPPKIVIGIGIVIILILTFYFYIAPAIGNSMSEYLKEREYQNSVKNTRKTSVNHESNSNTLANQRAVQEKDWNDFQPVRAEAQAEADKSKQDLINQEGAYKNAINGNVTIDPNLTLRERRKRVLARDRTDYPSKQK